MKTVTERKPRRKKSESSPDHESQLTAIRAMVTTSDFEKFRTAAENAGLSMSSFLRDRLRSREMAYERILQLLQSGDRRITSLVRDEAQSCIFHLTEDALRILSAMTKRLEEETGVQRLQSVVVRGLIYDAINPLGRPPAPRLLIPKRQKSPEDKLPVFSFHVRRIFLHQGGGLSFLRGNDLSTLDAIDLVTKRLDIKKSEFYCRAIANFRGKLVCEPAYIDKDRKEKKLEREQIIIRITEEMKQRLFELADKGNYGNLKPYPDAKLKNSCWYPPELVGDVLRHHHSLAARGRASKADVARSVIYEELERAFEKMEAEEKATARE